MIAVGVIANQPLSGQKRTGITNSMDAFKLVTLRGNTHPLANPKNDRGPVPDDTRIDGVWLLLKRSPERQAAFTEYLDELQDPKSPNYHHWLTAGQIGDRFGPSQEDIESVTQWLQSSGFKVNLVYPHRTLIDFSGTVGQLAQAFHTQIHYFDVRGQRHFANVSDPQIPEALQSIVAGPVSLNNIFPRRRTGKKVSRPTPDYATSFGQLVVPGDLATIYNLNGAFAANYTGEGVTIAVVEDSDMYSLADWGVFRKEFGLARPYPHAVLTQYHPQPPPGGFACNDPGTLDGVASEASVDVEWASAAAPNATIWLASCADTVVEGWMIALQNMITNSAANPVAGQIPAVISMSYGNAESDVGTTMYQYINDVYSVAVGAHVSLFVAAGDSGAAGADRGSDVAEDGIQVSAYATTPYNVAVGGTDFGDVANGITSGYWNSGNNTYFDSAESYIQEIPWNDTCASLLKAHSEGYPESAAGALGFCNSVAGENLLAPSAGSGGPSLYASECIYSPCGKPLFQRGFVGNPADSTRDIPDVSLFAAGGPSPAWGHAYVDCYSNTADTEGIGAPCTGDPSTWAEGGGTSFASPIMAGIMALVVQKYGGQPQGNAVNRIYAMAGNTYGGSSLSQCNSSNGRSVGSNCIFYDVTQGDMDVPCIGTFNCYLGSIGIGLLSISDGAYQQAYGAGQGWDFATGIGTVNAYNFVKSY